ncbi:hypothetical protein B0T10DRAFT_577622 [Thelonectria olida]|uniref:DUF1446-domain-containing protein n=1 Tax=Thelonectria olida TaxID=1576542 RepID=A0A9P8WFG5_9HYPO|nr:hypothetical protein B0T10DRAFT_577622 [Thelonectria olida]
MAPSGTSDHATNGANGQLSLGIPSSRPIRIAGCSGGVYDRKRAIKDMAKNEDVDVITGDWMSEANMTLRGSDKRDHLANRKMTTGSNLVAKGYEPYFLEELEPAIPWLAKKGTKIAVNAGASDVHGLAEAVKGLIKKHGVDLKVGVVDGDDVTEAVLYLYKKEPQAKPSSTSPPTSDPVYAQCYLGGVDIVLCGHVADASVTIGAAMWWWGWNREDPITKLAGALMVGHIIECSTYATGGYYSGFKDLGVNDLDMEYPIASVEENGECVITMEQGRDGLVTTATIASQLLYEIQGPLYYNSDVTASIEGVNLEQVGKSAVRVSGIKGLPAPPTTKVGITAKGGWQAEFHFYLTGLDIEEKAAMIESRPKPAWASGVPENPQSQAEGTVDLHTFAQTRDEELLEGSSFVDSDRGSFARFCIENLLQSYPGGTMAPDMRTAVGRPFFEYWVSLMPQSFVKEMAHLPDDTVGNIDPPTKPSYAETSNPVDLASLGPTTRGPLGWIVMGRSGDKSSNANMGLFVRHEDEWDWFRTMLSTAKLRELLGKDDVGHQIDRSEMPNIRVVHFLLKDHLDRGFNSRSSFNSLGKSKHVDIPNKFLERGKVWDGWNELDILL